MKAKTFFNFFLQRSFSSLNEKTIVQPKVIYDNCDLQKDQILKENKNKSVIYRFVNKINGKTYVGSSTNFTTRLYKYFSLKHLVEHKTHIHNALLKYGFFNFRLEILEYPNANVVIEREQYYLNLLAPEYNILATAGSSLGFKHSQETLYFFRNIREVSEETKKNLAKAAIGRVLTEKDKNKIAEKRKGIKLSDETRAKMSATTAAQIGVSILVKNINTDETIEYKTITEAAGVLGVSRTAINKVIKSGKLLKNTYLIEKK